MTELAGDIAMSGNRFTVHTAAHAGAEDQSITSGYCVNSSSHASDSAKQLASLSRRTSRPSRALRSARSGRWRLAR